MQKTLKNNMELVGKWTLRFEEVSNNVYKVELIDNFGRHSGTTDNDLNRAIETCISYAFDTEKQLNNTLNKFTYDTFKYFLADQKLLVDNYSDNDFGSWIIEKINKRIILDGSDSSLSLQNQNDLGGWKEDFTSNLKDLTFTQLKELKVRFENGN